MNPVRFVSIDTLLGRLRVYVSVAGNPPKCVQQVDIAGYEQAVMTEGFEFDTDQIEQFRQDPEGYMRRHTTPEGELIA